MPGDSELSFIQSYKIYIQYAIQWEISLQDVTQFAVRVSRNKEQKVEGEKNA